MIPEIKWAQTHTHILFKILIDNVTGLNLNFDKNKLSFSGNSEEKEYSISVEFFKDIDDNLSSHSYKINEHYIDCKVAKKEADNWDFLVKNHSFYKNHIKVDWIRWVDTVPDSESTIDDNLESLMRNIYNQKADGGGSCNSTECAKTCSKNCPLVEESVNDNLNLNDLEATLENNGVASGESTPPTSDCDDELEV